MKYSLAASFGSSLFLSAIASATLVSKALANPTTFLGSDTLAGVISDAIVSGGLENELQYLGGGSSSAEKALLEGSTQGIVPMSKPLKPETLAALKAKGLNYIPTKIALDGVSLFAHSSNALPSLEIEMIRKIFACEVTDWSNVPGSNKTGAIDVVRRNDESGTTDAFKSFTKVTFGSCAKPLPETIDVANYTSSKPDSIGYSGLTAKREGNKFVALKKDASSAPMYPTVQNIRSKLYPFSRDLLVYEAQGSLSPSEDKLMKLLKNRSFLDPIVQDNEFFTLN